MGIIPTRPEGAEALKYQTISKSFCPFRASMGGMKIYKKKLLIEKQSEE